MHKDAWKALCEAVHDADRDYGLTDPETGKVYIGKLTTEQRMEQFHLKLANVALSEMLYQQWHQMQR